MFPCGSAFEAAAVAGGSKNFAVAAGGVVAVPEVVSETLDPSAVRVPAHQEVDPCSDAASRRRVPAAAYPRVVAAAKVSLAAATHVAEAPAPVAEVARREVRSFGPRRRQRALCLSQGW